MDGERERGYRLGSGARDKPIRVGNWCGAAVGGKKVYKPVWFSSNWSQKISKTENKTGFQKTKILRTDLTR